MLAKKNSTDLVSFPFLIGMKTRSVSVLTRVELSHYDLSQTILRFILHGVFHSYRHQGGCHGRNATGYEGDAETICHLFLLRIYPYFLQDAHPGVCLALSAKSSYQLHHFLDLSSLGVTQRNDHPQ